MKPINLCFNGLRFDAGCLALGEFYCIMMKNEAIDYRLLNIPLHWMTITVSVTLKGILRNRFSLMVGQPSLTVLW